MLSGDRWPKFNLYPTRMELVLVVLAIFAAGVLTGWLIA